MMLQAFFWPVSAPNRWVLRKIKDVFVSNTTSHGKVDLDSIFANPIYERLIGRFEEVDRLFDGRLKAVIHDMQECFRTAA
jgi:hypothetical protein